VREGGARAQVDADMVAEVAKLGFDRDMVVDSLRKRQQNKARPARRVPRRRPPAWRGLSARAWALADRAGAVALRGLSAGGVSSVHIS